MDLYIRVVDNQSQGNPAHGDNLRQAFNEIPEVFEPFEWMQNENIQHSEHKIYVNVSHVYAKRADGVWTNEHVFTPMSDEEKEIKFNLLKNDLLERQNNFIKNCTYNVDLCTTNEDLAGAEIWNTALENFKNWSLESIDENSTGPNLIFTPEFPKLPQLKKQNIWELPSAS
jgi:hypothetical protein